MPIVQTPSFIPPFYLTNAHLQTIYPALFRKISGVNYHRERLELSDGDFMDLDYSLVPDSDSHRNRNSRRIAVVLHGLEGSADRPYVRGMIKHFNLAGWDGVGINFRGCSGVPNRLARTYHSGASEDLHEVVEHLVRNKNFEHIAIIGFSLGGNITLKYIGEQRSNLHPNIICAVAFSVPVHLESASYELAKWQNKLYMNRFMRGLKEKIKSREHIIKNQVDLGAVYSSNSFLDFDEHYTAPVHGFSSAKDYWTRSSALQFLPNIRIPCLLVNAKNDSFLSPQCYPRDVASANNNFYLQMPEYGGHVGFYMPDKDGSYWSERSALAFCQKALAGLE